MLLTEYNEIQREELLRKTERKEAMMSALNNLMDSLKLSFEQAAAALKIPAEEYDFYRNSIIQKNEDALHKSEQ